MDGGVLLENLQDENIKRTRSGRISMPRLAWWAGERVMTTLKENDSPKYIAPSTIDKIGLSILPTDIYERQKRMSTTISQNSMVDESINARPSTSRLPCNPQRRSSGGVRQSARTRSKQPATLSKTRNTQKGALTDSASLRCSGQSSQVSKTRLAKKHPDALVCNNRSTSKSGAAASQVCSKLPVVVLRDISKIHQASKELLQKQTRDVCVSRLLDCTNASMKKGNTQFGNARQLEDRPSSSALSSHFSQDSLLPDDDLSSTVDGTFVIASKKAKTDIFNAPLCPIQDLCNLSRNKQSAVAKRSSNDANFHQQQSRGKYSGYKQFENAENHITERGVVDNVEASALMSTEKTTTVVSSSLLSHHSQKAAPGQLEFTHSEHHVCSQALEDNAMSAFNPTSQTTSGNEVVQKDGVNSNITVSHGHNGAVSKCTERCADERPKHGNRSLSLSRPMNESSCTAGLCKVTKPASRSARVLEKQDFSQRTRTRIRDSVILSSSESEDEAEDEDDGYSDNDGCHQKVKQSQKRMPSRSCQVLQQQFPITCSRRMESELHCDDSRTASAEEEEVPARKFKPVHTPQRKSCVEEFADAEPLGRTGQGQALGRRTTCSKKFVTGFYGKQTGKIKHGSSLHNRSKHVPHKGDDDDDEDLINFLPEMPGVAVQRGKQAADGEPIDDSHSMSFHEVVRSIEKKMAAVQQKYEALEEEECCPKPRRKLQTRESQLVSIREDQEGKTGVAPQDKRRNGKWEQPVQGSDTEDSEDHFIDKEEQLMGRGRSSQRRRKGYQNRERMREISSSDEEVLQLHEENAEKPFHQLRPRQKIRKPSEEFCHSRAARRGTGNKENCMRNRTARTKDIGYIFDTGGSKNPGRDTLKRKKWLAAKMEECNRGHNDDMFEGKDEFSIKELFSLEKQFGHDMSEVDLNFDTPKLNQFRIDNQEKKAYNVNTCATPSEFNCNRQAADEYLYRRNKMHKEKRSGNMVSSSKTVVPVDTEMQEAVKNVDEMLRRIDPKLSDSEISSEELNDYYFSDEEGSPLVFRNYT